VWAVRTSQETHHVSATEHRMQPFSTVCCGNHTEHTNAPYGQKARLELIDFGEVFSLTHRALSTPQKLFYFCLWYSFVLEVV
jgi:hypothetical protein